MTWHWSYWSDATIYQVHNLLQWKNIWHDIYHVHNLLQREDIWHDIGRTGQTPQFTRFTIYCNEKIYDMTLVLPVRHPHLPGSQFIAERKYMTWHWSYRSDTPIYQVHNLLQREDIWHDIGRTGQTPQFTRFTIYCNEKIYDITLVLPVRHPNLPGSQLIAERKYMTWHWSYRSDTPIYQVHNLLQREDIWHDIGQTGQTPQFTRFTIYCNEKIYDMTLVLPVRHPHLPGSQFIAERKYMTWHWSYRSDTPIYQVHNLLQRENIWHDIGLTSQTPQFIRFTIYCNEKIYDMILVLLWTIGVVVRMSILDTKVAGSNLSINMFSHWARDFIRIASVDSAVKWVPGGDNLVKGVQCYELFGGIAHKNHTFSFLTSQTSPFTRYTIYCMEKIYDMTLVLPVRHPHLPGSQFIAMRKYDMILVLPVRHPHLAGSKFIAEKIYDMTLVLPVRHPHLPGSQFIAMRKYMT